MQNQSIFNEKMQKKQFSQKRKTETERKLHESERRNQKVMGLREKVAKRRTKVSPAQTFKIVREKDRTKVNVIIGIHANVTNGQILQPEH